MTLLFLPPPPMISLSNFLLENLPPHPPPPSKKLPRKQIASSPSMNFPENSPQKSPLPQKTIAPENCTPTKATQSTYPEHYPLLVRILPNQMATCIVSGLFKFYS